MLAVTVWEGLLLGVKTFSLLFVVTLLLCRVVFRVATFCYSTLRCCSVGWFFSRRLGQKNVFGQKIARRKNYGARTGRSILKFCEESARKKILALKAPNSWKAENWDGFILQNYNITLLEKAKVEIFPLAGSKKCFRPKNRGEEELWGENGAFGTEILRGIRQKQNPGQETTKKWKTEKSGNPKNGKLVCQLFWLFSH